ncbi:MAG: hypothetical protein Q4F60_03030, partial [Candidatus Saccharibacteria bacterium]|nr:hypothetical protein [Candidatus Saccharibacteria bacterium]
EFPKLYDFSIKYSTLIKHEDEIESTCKFMRDYRELVLHADEALAAYRLAWGCNLDCDASRDELEAVVQLVQVLRGNSETENAKAETSFEAVAEKNVETDETEGFEDENVKAKPEVEAAVDVKAETIEVEIEAEAETEVEAEVSSGVEVETEVEPESESDPKPEAEAEVKSEAETTEVKVEEITDSNKPEAEAESNKKATKTRIPASERRAMTETENKKLQELAERGYSHRQIGQMIGCARYCVNNVLSGNSKTWPITWIEKLNELDLDNLPEKPNNHSHSPKKKPQNADEVPEEPA